MVEYAVLLILLVTLFVGGTELGLTTLASNKNTEAAKTGISEYAEINQLRLNYLNSVKQFQLNLSSFNCEVFTESGSMVSCTTTTATDFTSTLDSIDNTSAETRIADLMDLFDALLTEADAIADSYDSANNESTIDDNFVVSQGPSTVIANYSTLAIERPISDSDFNDLIDLEKALIESSIPNLNTFANGSEEDTLNNSEKWQLIHREGRLKYRALILVQYIKLSLMPTMFEMALNNASLNIYDFGSTTPIVSPTCNADGTYDDGFPTETGYQRYVMVKYKDESNLELTHQEGDVIYLFNPMPIDTTNCNGLDTERDNKPRARILIDGYTPTATKLVESGKTFAELYVPGLPKLNQSMYSNYIATCIDGTSQYVACSSNNVAQRLLKPPGKICFSNTETNGVDSCDGSINPVGVTGFYFFANANDSPAHSFEYTQNDYDKDGDNFAEFSPAIQLECSPTPDKSNQKVFDDDNCDGTQSKVRIHTRYRRVFEGFLTFGLQTLTQPELLPYFYNPNQVGVAEHVVIGSHGSEVGPLGRGGSPTIKHFMDFRGCYEVDVETNQVSACN